MKVFISWSGERSESLAKALREWFPLVLHFVEPWLSKSDIEAGERWSVEIAKELEASNFGILCVTKDNLGSPWILFEAGALAKSMQDGKVIPLLLDLDFKEVSGPLAQFQAKKSEQGGIRELVLSLNKAAKTPVPDAQLDKLFGALWPQLEAQLAAMPKGAVPAKLARPQGEILEELVSSVRNVELRFRDMADDEPSARRRRRRAHPGMLRELTYHIGRGPRDPIQLVVFASMVREDVPWLYELAVDAYRAIRGRNTKEAQEAYRRFREALEFLRHSPFIEELGGESKWLKMMMYEGFSLDDAELLESPSSDEGASETLPTSTKKKKRVI